MKNDVIKITECNELVKKVNNINITDNSHLVKKNWLWHKNEWNWKKSYWSWSW